MRANGKWELYRKTDTTKTEYRLNSATECLKTSRFTESEILICCLIIAGQSAPYCVTKLTCRVIHNQQRLMTVTQTSL